MACPSSSDLLEKQQYVGSFYTIYRIVSHWHNEEKRMDD